MFSQKDIKSIDRSYFNVISAGCYCIVLQSKNSKHYWSINHEEYSHFSTCRVCHKHNYSDPFHPHRNRPNLQSALADIRSHDSYQINVRDKEKARRAALRRQRVNSSTQFA